MTAIPLCLCLGAVVVGGLLLGVALLVRALDDLDDNAWT